MKKRGLRPAEQVFAEEVARLDQEDPGWDREGRIAAARALLRKGASRELLVATYGQEIVDEAEKG